MLKSSSTFQPQGTMLILLTLLEFEPFREFSSNSCGFELIHLLPFLSSLEKIRLRHSLEQWPGALISLLKIRWATQRNKAEYRVWLLSRTESDRVGQSRTVWTYSWHVALALGAIGKLGPARLVLTLCLLDACDIEVTSCSIPRLLRKLLQEFPAMDSRHIRWCRWARSRLLLHCKRLGELWSILAERPEVVLLRLGWPANSISVRSSKRRKRSQAWCSWYYVALSWFVEQPSSPPTKQISTFGTQMWDVMLEICANGGYFRAIDPHYPSEIMRFLLTSWHLKRVLKRQRKQKDAASSNPR